MKNCQAIKKGGVSCAANGCHIVMVWTLNNVAYPQDKLPQLYANHGWVLQALNFCGSHRNVLIGGKPVNISSIIPVEVNQPKEGIIMTNNVNMQCKICSGTGYDADFDSPCGCPAPKVKQDGVTERQAKFLTDLIQQITAIMKVDLTWADVTTKKEASEIIELLRSIKAMVIMVKVKKKANKVSPEQIEKIRTAINNKPTAEWVQKAMKKLITL